MQTAARMAAQPAAHTPGIPTNAEQTKPWYKHPWPWLLMFGPATVVVAGIHTAIIAFTQQDALVVGDYYKQGKAINQDLRRDRVAASMMMASTLRYDPSAGKLSGSLSSMGQPYQGKVSVSLLHSTLPSKDFRAQVQTDTQGRFSIPLPMLDIANWQVLVEGERGDWRLNGEWQWPQRPSVDIRAGAGPAE